MNELHGKIGQQALDLDYLRLALIKGTAKRKEMIDRTQALQVTRQCQIPSLSRSTEYYRSQEASDADRALTRRINELLRELPVAASSLLRNTEFTCPNQALAADIKYNSTKRGFEHPITVMV